MTVRTVAVTLEPGVPMVADAEVPGWVKKHLGKPSAWQVLDDGLELRQIDGERFSLTSIRAAAARDLDQQAFTARTSQVYDLLGALTRDSRHPHAVRLWNFIPDILAPLGDLQHRYLAFNAGRFASYLGWFGDSATLTHHVPTASGVGNRGDSLVVHCLTTADSGTPVENPLQVAAYRYSGRYGSPPPTFARATRLDAQPPLLLVGGTASIRGEDSTHHGRLRRQLDDTIENLAMLVGAGLGICCDGGTEAACRSFQALRVYWVNEADLPRIQDRVQLAFPTATEIEYVGAELCRPELLVEIEGVAGPAA